ncbi:hypothetical protein PS2_006923 [Malus domestica]
MWWEHRSRCDNLVSKPIPGWKCADEDHEAFWELTGFGFHRNSEVKRENGQSIPSMGDPVGSSARVSSQKQNYEGVLGAQSRQYLCYGRVELGMWWEPELRCDNLVSKYKLGSIAFISSRVLVLESNV